MDLCQENLRSRSKGHVSIVDFLSLGEVLVNIQMSEDSFVSSNDLFHSDYATAGLTIFHKILIWICTKYS